MKRKLKGYVLPTAYLLITITIFLGIIFMSNNIDSNANYNYSSDIIKEPIKSVIETTESTDDIILAPVEEKNATIGIYYYNKDDEATRQEQSLILYEDTYLPNSGVLYISDKTFDVKSSFNGKVIEVKDDEILGSYVVIEHNPNLKTYYYGLDKITVSQGEEILKGTLLGVSKENNIYKEKNSFLFEVYYKGETINPEEIINKNIKDYE